MCLMLDENECLLHCCMRFFGITRSALICLFVPVPAPITRSAIDFISQHSGHLMQITSKCSLPVFSHNVPIALWLDNGFSKEKLEAIFLISCQEAKFYCKGSLESSHMQQLFNKKLLKTYAIVSWAVCCTTGRSILSENEAITFWPLHAITCPYVTSLEEHAMANQRPSSKAILEWTSVATGLTLLGDWLANFVLREFALYLHTIIYHELTSE